MTSIRLCAAALFSACFVSAALAAAETAVEPLMPIEDTWDIEDTHAEAASPLVSAMRLAGAPLAYDCDSNTFYCTLGMEQGDEWPELALTMEGADSLRAAWVDDYSYDSCRDAIAAGTRYDLITWTDTEEQHIGIVFTGLPIAILSMDGGELTREDLPGRFTVTSYGADTVSVPVYAHKRGRRNPEKFSARIELHEDAADGIGGKQKLSLLGMPKDSDWLLMGTADDPFGVNNYMGWQVWRGFGDVITPLHSELCEVFFENHYFGLYQLMQRINADKELKRIGGNTKTDIVSRLVDGTEPDGKPLRTMGSKPNNSLEIRYLPKQVSEDNAFAVFRDAYRLLTIESGRTGEEETDPLSDEEFTRLVLANFDLRNILENYVLEEAIDYYDNMSFSNNTYLWALMQEDRSYRIYISPWDLDNTFLPLYAYRADGTFAQEYLNGISPAERILDLDIGGARSLLWEIWKEKRAGVLSDDALRSMVESTWHLLTDSGAGSRNLARWNPTDILPGKGDFEEYVVEHQYFVEENFEDRWPMETSEDK